MKRWLTTQQMANEIAQMDKSNGQELNISQCNKIASNIKSLYSKGGKESVIKNIRACLPSYPNDSQGLNMDQKNRVEEIVKSLFFWHFLPWSRVRSNMVRIGSVKL